jgi:glycosyltransferase involved in cell wall biosynthesis/tRNA A-37 threonylcarbamoyl transferase component Bud32
MRVLHLDTETGWRGGQRQALLLASELQRSGAEQLLMARPDSPLLHAAAAAGVAVRPLMQRFEADPVAARTLRRVFQWFRPSVVHVHAGHAHGVAALALPHADERTWRLVVSRRVDNPLRRSLFSRWKWSRADRILCVSEAIRREVLRAPWIAPSRVAVVYSAVPARARSRAEPWRPNCPARLVSVGSLVAHKGHDVLIRAVRLLESPAELCIYGEGPEREALERLIDELDVRDRVRLAGFDPDVLERLAEHDLYVHPSRGEGLGTSILDAMLAGLPVVAADAGGIGEIVQQGRTGRLVQHESAEELARAIDAALRDPEQSQRLAEGARSLVAERHGVAQLAAATLGEYERAVESVPAPLPTLERYRVFDTGNAIVLERTTAEGLRQTRPGEAASMPETSREPEGRGQMRAAQWRGVACWEKRRLRGGLLGSWLPVVRRPLERVVRGLDAEEKAREAGVAAPVTVFVELRKDRGAGFSVRSMSEVYAGWRDLEAVLGAGEPPSAVPMALGKALRRLHDHGLDHGDLNVKNVLVGPNGEVALVDFDPARSGRPLPLGMRRRRLGRLRRSLLKTKGRTEPWFSAVVQGYGMPELWGPRQEARARLLHAMHALLWERV